MKLVKQKTPFLVMLLAVLFIVSCSDDTGFNEVDSDVVNLKIRTNSTSRGANIILNCADASMSLAETVDYKIVYKAGVSEQRKNEIRQYHSSNIHCIDFEFEPDNPDTEIWTCYGCSTSPFNNCRPKAQQPEDPDIESIKI